jgi:uncharacterized protein YbcI
LTTLYPTLPDFQPSTFRIGATFNLRDVRRAAHRSSILPGDNCWERETSRAMQIDPLERARQGRAIGTAISKLHREHYGRGAKTTRTVYQRNHVVSFLEDIYTPVERTLIDADQEEAVKGTRQVFQMAMRERFSAAVEEITGRKVIQFMSQVSFDPDMAAEIFVL